MFLSHNKNEFVVIRCSILNIFQIVKEISIICNGRSTVGNFVGAH